MTDSLINITMTQVILIITLLISFLGFRNKALFDKFKHYPIIEKNNRSYYRLLTAGFLHGSWIHLGINMFVFWEFGRVVEYDMLRMFGNSNGKLYFIIIYLATIILANIPSYLMHKNNSYFSSIGASGAVAGILFIYTLIHPWTKLYLYGIVPIYAIVGAIAYLFYSSWASKNRNDHIDHSAHFYGAVFGVVLLLLMNPKVANLFVTRMVEGFPF